MDISKNHLYLGPRTLVRGGRRPTRVGHFTSFNFHFNEAPPAVPSDPLVWVMRNRVAVSGVLVLRPLFERAMAEHCTYHPETAPDNRNDCGVGLVTPELSLYFEGVMISEVARFEAGRVIQITGMTFGYANTSRHFKPRVPR